jgi:acyl-[acyl-carrier-protein]-phospholipid O-acyltransferase/long-chain-fatty-acid--[acyl-carrier-protein] ligase
MNTFSKITQFFAWFIIIAFSKPFFRIEVRNKQNLIGVRPPAILISNHIRFYDSFLYRIAVGLWSPLSPLRFMGVTKFNSPALNFLSRIGVVQTIYFFMGVVTVVTGLGTSKNLEEAKRAIRGGAVIAMFPEGRMYYDDTVGPFKWGAAILAEETDVPLMPFAIRKHGRRIIINIGKSFYVDKQKGPTENTEIMRDVIVGLFNDIEF